VISSRAVSNHRNGNARGAPRMWATLSERSSLNWLGSHRPPASTFAGDLVDDLCRLLQPHWSELLRDHNSSVFSADPRGIVRDVWSARTRRAPERSVICLRAGHVSLSPMLRTPPVDYPPPAWQSLL